MLIDVYGDGPIDREDVAWFLSQNSLMSVDGLGTGIDCDEAVVLALVDRKSPRMMKVRSGLMQACSAVSEPRVEKDASLGPQAALSGRSPGPEVRGITEHHFRLCFLAR